MHTRIVVSGFIFTLALSFAFTGTTFAAAPTLMSRVNEALQMAGIPVNPETQQSFAAGVANGHYISFDQLVNAMKWHKAHGRWTASWNQAPWMTNTWAFKGTVTEVNSDRLEMWGINTNGVEVSPKFRITENTQVRNGVLLTNAPNDVRYEVKDEIRRGSVVTVWATTAGEALVIKNMAPWGQGDFYGPVDCPSCAGASK